MTHKRRVQLIGYGASILGLLVVGAAFSVVVGPRSKAARTPVRRPFNRHATSEMFPRRVGEAPRVDTEHVAGPEQER